ncbi:hypothetical protein GWA97_07435 [Flavobacterium sp. LaA7.5]|nr:hypothetical protein [Flavobacterium salilacus subsp. altitudinum]
MENVAAFMYGTEYAERMQKFDAGVAQIESENSSLFEDRGLSGCYVIQTFQNNTVQIIFTESDLPPRIVKQVLDLFGSLFPKP